MAVGTRHCLFLHDLRCRGDLVPCFALAGNDHDRGSDLDWYHGRGHVCEPWVMAIDGVCGSAHRLLYVTCAYLSDARCCDSRSLGDGRPHCETVARDDHVGESRRFVVDTRQGSGSARLSIAAFEVSCSKDSCYPCAVMDGEVDQVECVLGQ